MCINIELKSWWKCHITQRATCIETRHAAVSISFPLVPLMDHRRKTIEQPEDEKEEEEWIMFINKRRGKKTKRNVQYRFCGCCWMSRPRPKNAKIIRENIQTNWTDRNRFRWDLIDFPSTYSENRIVIVSLVGSFARPCAFPSLRSLRATGAFCRRFHVPLFE